MKFCKITPPVANIPSILSFLLRCRFYASKALFWIEPLKKALESLSFSVQLGGCLGRGEPYHYPTEYSQPPALFGVAPRDLGINRSLVQLFPRCANSRICSQMSDEV